MCPAKNQRLYPSLCHNNAGKFDTCCILLCSSVLVSLRPFSKHKSWKGYQTGHWTVQRGHQISFFLTSGRRVEGVGTTENEFIIYLEGLRLSQPCYLAPGEPTVFSVTSFYYQIKKKKKKTTHPVFEGVG